MQGTSLTVVMYHYVRRLADSPYPRIKGLEADAFEAQLDYIERNYTPISGPQLCSALAGNSKLPEMPILLTFDDGYIDHFQIVFPALQRRGMAGAFFPPVNAVRDRVVLDVNKIHFILAVMDDLGPIIARIDHAVGESGSVAVDEYKEKHLTPSRYDTSETMYVKRMLQFALPENVRGALTSSLFSEFVSSDERAFADGLYLSEENLKEMLSAGMTIGGHGYSHRWLNRLPDEEQAREVKLSLDWLRTLGVAGDALTYCYPFGGYNDETLRLLKEENCRFAVTTKVELNRLESMRSLEIARIDTNDLPRYRNAARVAWTDRARNHTGI